MLTLSILGGFKHVGGFSAGLLSNKIVAGLWSTVVGVFGAPPHNPNNVSGIVQFKQTVGRNAPDLIEICVPGLQGWGWEGRILHPQNLHCPRRSLPRNPSLSTGPHGCGLLLQWPTNTSPDTGQNASAWGWGWGERRIPFSAQAPPEGCTKARGLV